MYVPRTFLEEITPWRSGLPMLFIHTPKCGGSFVGKSFHRHQKKCISLCEPNLSGHLLWKQYRDRLGSLGGPRGGEKSGYHLEHEMFQRMTFSNYVDWLDDPDAHRTETFDMGKQISDWVLDEDGNIAVDHILKQESLVTDLSDMARAYGIRIRLPNHPVNVSSSNKRYQDYYTAEDTDKIAARHQRDFRHFEYEF